MWMYRKREISKEDYDAIIAKEKNVIDFFSIVETAGYGAIVDHTPREIDGKYYITYGISDSCD